MTATINGTRYSSLRYVNPTYCGTWPLRSHTGCPSSVECTAVSSQDVAVARCPDCGTARVAGEDNLFVCSNTCGADPLAEDDVLLEWNEAAYVDGQDRLLIVTLDVTEEGCVWPPQV